MERLQKVIAQAGVASRRKAENLIIEGKVKVNGQVVTELGTKVAAADKIEVNGIPLVEEEKKYFLFYKPRGVISAVKDDKSRKVVTDYFTHIPERVYPVGRLDYDTSGLLLLSNDGEFTHLLTHPMHEIKKTYVAKVKGIPVREALKKLERGIVLEDGKTAPAKVQLQTADKRKNSAILEITIHEGRNRQVRRMLEAIGHPVIKLKRENLAFLNLHGLNAGEFRELTPHEVKRLKVLAKTGQ
ncbi:ribosomal large subunit pseudouridine synthase B [Siminovitchia terrae]|uniref:Pseudouridine synthase n=1 Tax=Siminovitchia terrae TaxID=1914933 RepID=A0A429XDF7_SIMTE|nr:pseudouridine synthase [Siminovitchia terrae]RST61331.1 rRNA pseudouridine synthase [Siminovitchia terrae]GIN89491.1 ribosomal large subunit pseudouridine synthase B [Siminovitchia terrae]GIN96482.1 ribosomal large subunit pseudouridine synthase B [Siminovitchia terrae]